MLRNVKVFSFLSQQISAYKINLPEGKKHKKGVKTPRWRDLGRGYYIPFFSREEAERKCNFPHHKKGKKRAKKVQFFYEQRGNKEKNYKQTESEPREK